MAQEPTNDRSIDGAQYLLDGMSGDASGDPEHQTWYIVDDITTSVVSELASLGVDVTERARVALFESTERAFKRGREYERDNEWSSQ